MDDEMYGHALVDMREGPRRGLLVGLPQHERPESIGIYMQKRYQKNDSDSVNIAMQNDVVQLQNKVTVLEEHNRAFGEELLLIKQHLGILPREGICSSGGIPITSRDTSAPNENLST
ncbi:hypothetical protein SLA2020_255490 [Shorea laevis]